MTSSSRFLFSFHFLRQDWKERTRGCVVNRNAAQNRLADWACQIRCSMRAATVAVGTFNHEVRAFGGGVTWLRIGTGAVGCGVSRGADATNRGMFALQRYVAKGVAVEALHRLGAVLLSTVQMTVEGQPVREGPVGSLCVAEVDD